MNKIVYISGGMSGIKMKNFPEFNRVAKILRDKGYEVINPAEFNCPDGLKWEEYMKIDIPEMLKADIVATLYGWESSEGANLETYIATKLKMEVCPYWEML